MKITRRNKGSVAVWTVAAIWTGTLCGTSVVAEDAGLRTGETQTAIDRGEQPLCRCAEKRREAALRFAQRTEASQHLEGNGAQAPASVLSTCLVGRWDQHDGSYSDVWAEGNYAYLGPYRLGGAPARVFVIDISDPATPTLDETLFIPVPNADASPQDVKVGDGLLFVALEGDGDDSVAIYDVRNPANRQLIATIRVDGFRFIHNVFYDSGFLYIVNSATPQVAIVDLTTFDPDNPPGSPITSAKWIVQNVGSSMVHDVTVQNGRLYAAAWHSGLWIYDVTDVANSIPSFLGSVGGTSTHSMWPTDDGQFVVTGEERGGGGIQVYSITDNGGSLTLTFTDGLVSPNPGTFSVHNQTIIGNRLYNSWYDDGLQVFDIDANGLLNFVASYNTNPNGGGLGNWGVYPFLGDDRILLSDEEEGLFIVSLAVGDCPCPASSAPELQTQFVLGRVGVGAPEPKSRFIPIGGGDDGLIQSVRVTWDAMPSWPGGHIALNGQQKYMTAPFQVCENSSQGLAVAPPDCGPAPGQPQKWYWAANLTCDPGLAWSGDLLGLKSYCSGSGDFCLVDADCPAGTCGVDGVIHIVDQGIAPSRASAGNLLQPARYFVQLADERCTLTSEASWSPVLEVINSGWGDLVGSPGACPASVPNNDTTLIGDVTEEIRKFGNLDCAPKKSRCDMDQDFQVNFPTDVLAIVNAFSNGGGGFSAAAGPVCSLGAR